MRQVALILILCVIVMSCGRDPQQPNAFTPEEKRKLFKDPANLTEIKWLDSIINFGTINKGENVTITYRFKNVGEMPLVIGEVYASCGCAIVDYPRGPIKPDSEAKISVKLDSKGQVEAVRKYISVETNTFNKQKHLLYFVGRVRDCCGGEHQDGSTDHEYIR